MLPPPTLRQMTILFYLEQWIRVHDGTAPTYEELAELASCRSTRTIVEHVHSLKRKHLVSFEAGRSRTMFPTQLGLSKLMGFSPEQATADLEAGVPWRR